MKAKREAYIQMTNHMWRPWETVPANLSKNHPDHGKSLQEHLKAKTERSSAEGL